LAITIKLVETHHFDVSRSEHAALTPIITSVQEQGVAYYSALDLSLKTAQDGFNFSGDAGQLCDYLLDENNTVDDLQDYIRDLRSIAKRAHSSAIMTCEKFRLVRQGLNQASIHITSPSTRLLIHMFVDHPRHTG
jgi:hypothetical protein